MTARADRLLLRHDAVTDAALWARLRDGSRVFFADATAAEAAGYRPCARCCRAAYDVWKSAVNSGI